MSAAWDEGPPEKPRPQVFDQPSRVTYRAGKLGVYQPRRGDDGLWRYAMRVTSPGDHKEKWYPVGTCQSEEKGHETGDLARQCFRKYLLEHQTRFNIPRGDGEKWVACEICAEEQPGLTMVTVYLANHALTLARKHFITKRWAVIVNGVFAWALCPSHQNYRAVNRLLPTDITESIG